MGLRLMAQVIDHAKTTGSLVAKPQDEQFATKAPKIVVESAPKRAAS
jgi:methionyl-tRNA formyltransferase